MKHAQRIMKPLSIAIASLSASALAQNSGVTSPFATIPLNNQHITQITVPYVKPRIMLIIDDSGSMTGRASLHENQPGFQKSRIEAAIQVSQQLIDQIGDDAEWGYTSLGGNIPFVYMQGIWRKGKYDFSRFAWQPVRIDSNRGSKIGMQAYYNDSVVKKFVYGWNTCYQNEQDENRSKNFYGWYQNDTAWARGNNCVFFGENGGFNFINDNARGHVNNGNNPLWHGNTHDVINRKRRGDKNPYHFKMSNGTTRSYLANREIEDGGELISNYYRGEDFTEADYKLFGNDQTVDTQNGFVSAENMRRRLEFIRPDTHTMTTTAYVRAVDRIIEQQDLVCRKNYIIELTDGASFIESPHTLDFDIRNQFKNVNARMNSFFPSMRVCSNSKFSHDGAHKYPYGSCYLIGRFEKDDNRGGEVHHFNDTLKAYYQAPQKHGIAFFSQALKNGDFMTSRYANAKYPRADKEGTPWDKGITLPDGTVAYQQQNITTYTIGFALNKNATDVVNKGIFSYLQNGDTSGNGVLLADNEQELKDAFSQIAGEIRKENQYVDPVLVSAVTPAFAISTTTLEHLSAYLMLNSKEWGSELSFSKIDQKTGEILPNEPLKYAEYPSVRPFMMSVDGSYNPAIRSLYATSQHCNFARDLAVSDAFGFAQSSNCTSNELVQGLLPWLLRSRPDQVIDQNVQRNVVNPKVSKYRVRQKSTDPNLKFNPDPRAMGDVLASGVEAVTKITDHTIDNAKATRFILTGANDGMLYVFEASNDANKPYKLKFNYLPAMVEREGVYQVRASNNETVARNVYKTAIDGYGLESGRNPFTDNPHLYLNDGGIFWRTTSKKLLNGQEAKGQQTFMIASMGRGGRGFYALNLQGKSRVNGANIGFDVATNASTTWDGALPLFENEKGVNNRLGYTVGTPQVGLVATQVTNNLADLSNGLKQVMFINNGYLPDNQSINVFQTPAILTYDALGQMESESTGARFDGQAGKALSPAIELITKDGYTCAAYKDQDDIRKGAAASTPRLVDINMDNIFDLMYVGDQCGNLWRVDLATTSPSNWNNPDNIHLVYRAPDNSAPITTRPSIYRLSSQKDSNGKHTGQYVVMFGTGSNLYQSDMNDKAQQYFMGIFDDTAVAKNNSTQATQLSELITQEIIETKQMDKQGRPYIIRNLSGYNVAAGDTHYVPSIEDGGKGWKLKLTLASNAENASSEKVVTDSQVLTGTVYFSTVKYNRKEQEAQEVVESCYPITQTSDTYVESWQMTLDVRTGSNPELNNSYLSGFDKNVDSKGNKMPIAGLQQVGAASGVNIVSTNKVPSSINPNGGGESGEDGLNPGRKDCVTRDEWYTMIADQDGIHSNKLTVPLCASNNRLVRINLREVR